MAASVNKVILIGNIGKDPEVRYMTSGDPVATVSLATTDTWKDKEGAKQERTEWHRVVFFGKLAQIVADYVKKGMSIYVEGALRTVNGRIVVAKIGIPPKLSQAACKC